MVMTETDSKNPLIMEKKTGKEIEQKLNIRMQSQSTEYEFEHHFNESLSAMESNQSSGGCRKVANVGKTVKKERKKFPPALVTFFKTIAFLLPMFNQFAIHDATDVRKNKQQKLSDQCYALLYKDGGDCPSENQHDFLQRWHILNEICCINYPGKDVHCQMDYDTGRQYSVIGCFTSVLVCENCSVRIVFSNTGPELNITHLGDKYQRNDEPRMSWQVTFPYGTREKDQCQGLGQELLCVGRSGDNNLCTCKAGFEPRKTKTGCIRKKCPEGTHPARTELQPGVNCSHYKEPKFSCEPDERESSTTILPQHLTPSPTSRKPPEEEPSSEVSPANQILLAFLALCIAFLLIALFIYVFLKCKRCNQYARIHALDIDL